MHFKHLRGKHDQKDHGRRAIGGSRTSRVASRMSSSMSPSTVDQIRERAVDQAETAEKAVFQWENATTNEQKLRACRDLMDSSIAMMETFRRYHRQNQRGELVDDLKATTLEEQRTTIERVLLSTSIGADYHRKRYNGFVATVQAERKAKRQAERQAKRKKDREQARRDRTKIIPKPDTTTPFVSLESSGLKGWARQRPATPPDYTAFDQATRGEPDWMPLVRSRMRESARGILPRTFRDIDTTPEGMSVQMVIPDAPGASKMGDLSLDQVTSKDGDERPSFVRRDPWGDGVFLLGEEIFANQNTDADAFWNQTIPPATAWSTASPMSMQSVVEEYGEEGFKTINDVIRRGPDRERSFWSRIENDIQKTALQSPTNRARQRRLILDQIEGKQFTQSQISTMDAGMRPTPRTVMARRGVGSNTFGRMQQELRVGDRFTDDCFTSASINPVFNWRDSPMVNVILTEGTPALWTDGHALKSQENEVIIGRGVTYEVVSTDNERGWILRTVPPDGPYTPPPVSAYGNDDPLSPQARQFVSKR